MQPAWVKTANPPMKCLKAAFSLVLGAGLLCWAGLVAEQAEAFLRSSLIVPGHVTGLKDLGHRPEVAFDTRAREHIQIQMSSVRRVKVGDIVQVRYLPEAPRAAELSTETWRGTIFLATIGVAWVLGGVYAVCVGTRAEKASRWILWLYVWGAGCASLCNEMS
jgi:hypothetical protein